MHTQEVQNKLDEELGQACFYGEIKRVISLLNPIDKTAMKADVNARYGFPIRAACSQGHLDIIKYLLKSDELENHSDINVVVPSTGNDTQESDRKTAFFMACRGGHINVLKYLVSIKKEIGLDIDQNMEYSFFWVSQNAKFNVALYLMGLNEFKENKKQKCMVDFLLRRACKKGSLETIRTLFLEHNFMDESSLNKFKRIQGSKITKKELFSLFKECMEIKELRNQVQKTNPSRAAKCI